MRKNINKLVAFAIGISVVSGSVIPAFAADTIQNTTTITNVQTQANAKSVLTLNDAVKAAVSNSDTLKLDDKKISYQDKINDVNEEIDDASGVSGDKEDLNEDTRDITLKQLKQQRDFDEDKLIQKTTTAYNNIITSQMKIDKAAKLLEIKNKELSDAKLKKSLGLMTSIDLSGTELQIQSLQNQQKLSQNTLKDAQDSFKVLIGKDVTGYTLEQDIKYEKFKIDGSVDEYLDGVIDNYMKYSEELLKLNKDYLDDNKVTEDDVKNAKDTTDAATLTLTGTETFEQYMEKNNKYEQDKRAYINALTKRLTYLSTKLTEYGTETSLNENKKQLKEALKTIYTNMLATQDSIDLLKSNIELNNKQLSVAKLKYDLGMITKSEYNTQVTNSEDLDIQLRTAIDGYNTLKEKIQKPWLAF